jgi:signal transduction histidine kinase
MRLWKMEQTIPPEFQNDYNETIHSMNTHAARIVSLLGAILVPLFFITGLDHLMAPQQYMKLLYLRCGISAFCLAVYVYARSKRHLHNPQNLTFLTFTIVGFGIALMVRWLGHASPYYAGLNLVYLAAMVVPWGAARTALICGVVYSFYILPVLFFDIQELDMQMFVSNSQFQLFTIILSIIFSRYQEGNRRREILSRLTIAKQKRELEEIDRYKREFIANITHELKTPLAIVMANSELVLEQTDDPEKRAGIELIGKAAAQLGNHVDRIIAISNVDDPDAKPDLGNYDYTGIVRNVFELFEARAREENITYALKCPPGPLVVNADIVQIEEVLNNLVQNAFKFTPAHGIITVTVSTDGERVYTEITDSGVGIPEDKIDKIFDRMYQADGVLSKRHAGIGLGLYISRANVENHGGTITVNSKQGQGTSFKFSLPLHVDQSVVVKNRPYRGEDRRGGRRSGHDRRSKPDRRAEERRRRYEYQQSIGLDDLARMTYAEDIRNYENRSPTKPTILLVEDNAGMMKVIVEALRDEYNLLLAFDAFEALRKLDTSHESVALILCDIMMPGMSGFDFCEKIMQREECRQIPLIFITALMSQDDQLRGFATGATDYIIKPYNIKILKEKVAHWISRRQYEALLREASSSLEERVEQLSRIRDIILHEIRNPLQMIVGAGFFIDRLRQKAVNRGASAEEQRLWENVAMLEKGTDALKSVLEATRGIDMSAASSRRPEPLADVLDDALELTGHLMNTVHLDTDLDAMDNLIINCNHHLLVQVLVNLLRNATEAIAEKQPPDGGLIRITHELLANGDVVVSITDNGIGMEPEVAENLFTFRFTTKKDGTGIGLHFSKMIVKLHEGSIVARSRRGEGTTFQLQLPLVGAEEAVMAS